MFKTRTIKWNFLIVILCLVFISPTAASTTISDADLQEFRDFLYTYSSDFVTYLASGPTGSNWINLQEELEVAAAGEATSSQISTFIDYLARGNTDGAIDYMMSIFGGSPATLSSPVSSSQRASETVMRDLVIPAVKTKKEKKKAAEVKGKYPRLVAGYLRYEKVDAGSQDTDIYGLSIGLAWDVDNISYGFVIPYDYMEVGGVDTHRIGTIGFIQYHKPLLEDFTLGLTANLTYMYLDLDGSNIQAYGGGPSVSITYEKGDLFIPSLAVSYQYTTDDSGSSNDYQHLVKIGLNLGFRAGEDAVVNLFGIWNRDVSSYMEDRTNSFGDVGIEAHYNISETFTLSGGFKTVVGYEDFDANTIYLGGLIRF